MSSSGTRRSGRRSPGRATPAEGLRRDRYAEMRDRRRREREEAKRLTRQALLEAGLEAIIEQGLDVSLDDICARAGYTRGAFYVYFRDREDLLVAITEWVLGGILEALLGDQSPRTDVGATIERFFVALNAETWPLMPRIRIAAIRLLDAIDRWPALRARFDELILGAIRLLTSGVAEGQKLGRIRSDFEPGRLATGLVIMAMGTIMLHKVGIPIDFDRQRSAVLAMMMGGEQRPAARARTSRKAAPRKIAGKVAGKQSC